MVPPRHSQPLTCLAICLRRHRAGVQEMHISVIAGTYNLKATRLELCGKLLEFSLIKLAAQRMEGNAALSRGIHVDRL